MMCVALAKGVNKECQRPVPEGAEIRLCLLHMLLAHQEVMQRGGAQVVAAKVRDETMAIRTQGTGS